MEDAWTILANKGIREKNIPKIIRTPLITIRYIVLDVR